MILANISAAQIIKRIKVINSMVVFADLLCQVQVRSMIYKAEKDAKTLKETCKQK